MAWLNDIPGPSSQPHKGKEPEWTEQTELNWCSSIVIDGNEEEELNWCEVTFEDFLRYIHEQPEWLYEKLQIIHKQYKDVIEDCKAWLADSELNGQTKDSKVVLMKKQLKETAKHLN